jgi:hypothetical protein
MFVSYRWLDEGILYADGIVYHDSVQLTTQGRTFQIRKGDAVLLNTDETDGSTQAPCRIERMWEPAQNFVDPDPRPPLFTARWFWNKGDLEQLPYQWEGSLTREELVATMAVDEVVLSNHLDENELATIEGPCYMTYHATSENLIRPTASEERLPKSFKCQYKVDIMPANSSVKLLPMTPEDRRLYTRNLTADQRLAIQDQRRDLREQPSNQQSIVDRTLSGQEEGTNEDDDNGGGAAFDNDDDVEEEEMEEEGGNEEEEETEEGGDTIITTANTTTKRELVIESGCCKCFIEVGPNDTMADVRVMLFGEFDDDTYSSIMQIHACGDANANDAARDAFRFCVAGVRVSRKQERRKLAWDFMEQTVQIIIPNTNAISP